MLDHHKRKKNLASNRKAFSSIVGAIFAILVIVTLTGTFFVWSLDQNSRYVNAVADVNQRALDQQNESLNVTSIPVYTVDAGGTVTASFGVQNDGPITIQLASLWIQDLNGSQPYGYTVLSNVILSPGESWANPPTVQVNGAVSGDSFSGWLISTRGNVFPLIVGHLKGDAGEQGIDGNNGTNGSQWYVGNSVPGIIPGAVDGDFYLNTLTNYVYRMSGGTWSYLATLKGPEGPIGPTGPAGAGFNETGNLVLYNGTNGSTSYNAATALVAQGIGYVAMNFSKTAHLDYASGNATDGKSLAYPSFTYTISSTNATILRVVLMNEDPARDITLKFGSCIWSTCTVAGTVKSDKWSLLNVTNGLIYPSDTNFTIVLPKCPSFPNGTLDKPIETNVFFGPAGGKGADELRSAGNVIALNILLFGKIGPDDYGQNLPFIALKVL